MPVPHSYDNLTIPSTGPDEVSTDSNPAISNVESKFAAVSDQASHLKIRDGVALARMLVHTPDNGATWIVSE